MNDVDEYLREQEDEIRTQRKLRWIKQQMKERKEILEELRGEKL